MLYKITLVLYNIFMWPFKNTKLENRLEVLEFDMEFYKEHSSTALDASRRSLEYTMVEQPNINKSLIDRLSRLEETKQPITNELNLSDKIEIERLKFEANSLQLTIDHLTDNLNKLAIDDLELHNSVKQQNELVNKLKDEIQTLHYSNFELKASHEIALKKLKFELEEQKYNDFISMHNTTIEMTRSINIALVQTIVDKLKEIQQPIIMTTGTIQDTKTKQESGYKSI